MMKAGMPVVVSRSQPCPCEELRRQAAPASKVWMKPTIWVPGFASFKRTYHPRKQTYQLSQPNETIHLMRDGFFLVRLLPGQLL